MVARVYNHTSAPVNPAAYLDQAELDFGHWDIVRKMFEGTYVFSGCVVTATGTPDQNVQVASGVVSIGNALVAVTSGAVAMAAADATNARFDLVTVDTSGVKSKIDGAAGTNPCLPAYPTNKCVLAVVYRPANDNTIESNLIESVGAAPRLVRYVASGVIGLHDGSAGVGDAFEWQDFSGGPPASPASGDMLRQYLKTFGLSVGMFLKNTAGAEFGPVGMKEQATVYGKGPAGGLEPPLSGTWSDGLWGTLNPVGSWTVTGTPSVANDTANNRGRYANFQSGAVSGNDAGIETPAVFWANRQDSILVRLSLPDVTSIRSFVGFAAQTLATMVGADDPGTNYCGLQFSTPRTDTNWQAISRGTGTQTKTDLAVAPSANPVYARVIMSSASWEVHLLDQTFVVVGSASFSGSSKPGSTILCSTIAGVETQAAAARDLRVYHMEHHARNS